MNPGNSTWETSSIGEYCLPVSKIDPKALGRDYFKYVDIGSLEENSSSLEKVVDVSTSQAPSRARQHLKFGDSIFSTVRPYMKKIALITEEFDGEIASTGYCVLRPKKNKIDPKYLFYYLRSDVLLDQVLPLQRGVSYPAIRDGDLKSATIAIPSMSEQIKIVEILEEHLSRIDSALEDVKQAREKADQFRRSLLHAAFTGEANGVTIDASRQEWLLEELVDNLDSKRVPVNAKERASREGDVPYYGATGQVGTINDYLFNEDLLLLGEDGVQFFDPNKNKAYLISGPSWVNNHAHVLRARDHLVNQRLLMHFLNYFNYIGYANGTTRLKLTQSAMNKIPVSLPDRSVQDQILEFIEENLAKMDYSLEILHKLENQITKFRRSLLHAAFTGQLTKEDANV